MLAMFFVLLARMLKSIVVGGWRVSWFSLISTESITARGGASFVIARVKTSTDLSSPWASMITPAPVLMTLPEMESLVAKL